MKDSNANFRFFLGLLVLTVGLSYVGISPSKASKDIRSNRNPPQNVEPPRPRAEKYIGKYRIYANEPVLVTDITANGKQSRINSRIAAGEDWLRELTFKVKNISQKNIVFIYVSIYFPEAKAITGTLFAFDLRYGADPRLQAASTTEKPIKPEEAAGFVVSDASYRDLKWRIETRITPIKNINSVQIDVVRVIFDDDTAWATGSFMHRDPNNPKIWIDNN
jgi:hypothetical protein